MFGLSASSLLWWVNEIRIWAAALAGFAAVVTFLASYAQIRLQTVVSTEKDEALKRFQAESAERTSIANAEAARANQRAAELQMALQREIAARQPRTLSQEQHSLLVKGLQAAPKGRVIVKPNFMDMEATPFANQISRALAEAGFEGVGDAPLDIVALGEPGLMLAVREGDIAPPARDSHPKRA
jgi:hypothetical protein